jgi:hypothetical protein
MEAMGSLDYGNLSPDEAKRVASAIARGENFYGYIPSEAFDFIKRNFVELGRLGVLEDAWLSAYIFKSHFAEYSLEAVKAIFDACDRTKLRSLQPIDDPVNVAKNGRLSLFRGCAGPEHRMGMSWTASLDKAIWYAAHKAAYYDLSDLAVYATTVEIDEVYCRFNRNEEEFIVLPQRWWKINIPVDEFRLDRKR